MRICVVASTYPRFEGDGAGRFVQSISEALAQIGHEVDVVAPYHPAVAPFESPVRVHHFKYSWPDSAAVMGYAEAMQSDQALRPYAYALAPIYAISQAALLRRLMAERRYDAIHAHWVIPNGPAAAKIAGEHSIPLVISLHGSDIFMSLRHRFLQPIAQWAFGRAQGVSACSPTLREGAIRLGADPEIVRMMPWGADPGQFGDELHRQSATQLRSRLGLAPDSPTILSLGRLVRKKGIRYLVMAMPAVVDRFPDARLVIAGSGPELRELQSLAELHGIARHISFAGEVDWQDVPAYLAAGDIFVVPSVHDENGNADQLPTTILEAMAAGRPVVASRVSGIPLAVRHGETGFLLDEAEPNQLADAILSLLGSAELRHSFGTRARQLVEQELNWQNIARILESMMLSKPSGSSKATPAETGIETNANMSRTGDRVDEG